MGDDATYEEIEARISVVRDNIRDLIEQAAAAGGEAAEQRIADRLSDQEALLERLLKEHDAARERSARP